MGGVWQPDFNVIVCKTVNICFCVVVFKKDGTRISFELAAKFVVFSFRNTNKFCHSVVFLFLGDSEWNFERLGALAFGIGEHVELGDGERGDEVAAVLEAGTGFTSHACNNIHSDKGVRKDGFDGLHFGSKEVTIVPAAHEAKHFIISGLEGDVEMRHEMAGGGDKFNNFLCQQVGLNGGNAVAGNVVSGIQLVKEVQQVCLLVSPEITGVDTGEDDFLYAFGSYLAYSFEYLGDGCAAAASTGVRDGAVGAEVVTTVLDFEETAGAVAKGIGKVKLPDLKDIFVLRGNRLLLFFF